LPQGEDLSGELYTDLRDFIDKVEAPGQLRRIDGADLVCEIGGITEVADDGATDLST
jgi:3-polyprenyl-4-hydroxybenzoate decarboxylase